jgi:ArsR family metal-binding transcriptional regulator
MSLVESIQLVKALPCLAEPGKIIVIGHPSRAIDGVVPLVAAVAPEVIAYNPLNCTLVLRRQRGFITFYPDKIMITQVNDTAEGIELLAGIRVLLNQCWDRRDVIQPVTAARRAPRPLDLWSLLPQTNCRQCGEPTCMAFACALLLNRQSLENCLPLINDSVFAERRDQLQAMVLNQSTLTPPAQSASLPG